MEPSVMRICISPPFHSEIPQTDPLSSYLVRLNLNLLASKALHIDLAVRGLISVKIVFDSIISILIVLFVLREHTDLFNQMALLTFLIHPILTHAPPPSPITCSANRLILLPHNRPAPKFDIGSRGPFPCPLSKVSLPNPYDSNTKRWERVWLSVIREAVSTPHIALIGLGTGADAALRFLEGNRIDGGVLLVHPSGDEYFAGERHGRAYHWHDIRQNVAGPVVLVRSPHVPAEENDSLLHALHAEEKNCDHWSDLISLIL